MKTSREAQLRIKRTALAANNNPRVNQASDYQSSIVFAYRIHANMPHAKSSAKLSRNRKLEIDMQDVSRELSSIPFIYLNNLCLLL